MIRLSGGAILLKSAKQREKIRVVFRGKKRAKHNMMNHACKSTWIIGFRIYIYIYSEWGLEGCPYFIFSKWIYKVFYEEDALVDKTE